MSESGGTNKYIKWLKIRYKFPFKEAVLSTKKKTNFISALYVEIHV